MNDQMREQETVPLATELLRELKAQNKRLFIVAIAELLVILALLFIPTEEWTVTQEADGTTDTTIRANIQGGIGNESTTEGELQEATGQ